MLKIRLFSRVFRHGFYFSKNFKKKLWKLSEKYAIIKDSLKNYKGLIKIFERKKLASGVYFSKITDSRYKQNRVFISLFTDISQIPRENAAVAAYEFTECCERYPDYKRLSSALLDLYDASLSASTSMFSGARRTDIWAAALDDRYALEGEKLEREISKLMCDCIFRPYAKNGEFDEKIIEMLRAQLIDNIDSVINDKAVYAGERAAKTAFVGEANALPASGTHEEAEKITAKSAFDAYKEMLRTAHVEICAVGCSDFSETEKIFTEEFSNVERSDIYQLKYAPSALKKEPVYIEDTLEMQQAILRMYFKAPEMNDRPANAVFSSILGGMTTSRFFTNIREKQSLCYYCSCGSDRFLRTLTCTAGIEPDNAEKTREAMLAELRDICENGVSEDELEHAKLELCNALSSTYDSAFGISGWYLSQIIDEKFITPEEYAEQIKDVTPERVREAAKKYTLDTVYLLKNKE